MHFLQQLKACLYEKARFRISTINKVKPAKNGGFYKNLKGEEQPPKERKILNMAITRKFLKGMGLTEEQVDTIIEAHTETVDGLKADVDKYREDALKLPDVQKELNDLKAAGDGGLQKQLDELHIAVTAEE